MGNEAKKLVNLDRALRTDNLTDSKSASSKTGENKKKKQKLVNPDTQITVPPDDDFGGFDDEEDQEYIARAEKKWLKARGLDPKVADRKNPGKTTAANGIKLAAKAKL